MHDQRNPRVAQGVDPGGDRQYRRAIERPDPLGADAVLLDEVDRTTAAGELDHVRGVVDDLEGRRAVLALHQPCDVLVEDRLTDMGGDDIDELLSVENASQVAVVEGMGTWQPERGAGDHDGLSCDRLLVLLCGCGLRLVDEPVTLVGEVGWSGHG